jgi:hypothetical protein
VPVRFAQGRAWGIDWPWPAKFATILPVAVPVMVVSDQRRYSIIGTVLNGRRTRKPSQAAELIRGQS